MTGPLDHVRVLELSRILAGPWAAQTLADLGATVIKVEKPGVGDDTRTFGPPFLTTSDGRRTGESAYFMSTNRGKRSVTIDFVQPEGQRLVTQLAAASDIVIENFKVGGLAKFNLDYASLKSVNPGLIYCSITGFGQTGPNRDKPGYDFMIQGTGGLMSVTGEPDERPGGSPIKVGVAVADIFTGLYATIAILGALASRDRTGRGQHIDISLLDSQVSILANQAMNYLVSGQVPQRMGNAHPNIVPYQVFATSDGHVILAVGNQNQFVRFCEVAGRQDLVSDERFASNPSRVDHRDELIAVLNQIFRTRTSRYWIETLENAGVPCGPINNIADVFADPQVQARGMRLELHHPILGAVPSVASPIKYSETQISYDRAAPMLGEHTDEVLRDLLGVTPEEIARMRERGII
jgi:crotonobetainyl-CoA:carnitine CoA-transferase CaiB-like acyl-CoA transferase